MASPRMIGSHKAKQPRPSPDWEKYELRREAIPCRHPNGTAVAYSTEGAEHYAPLRGVAKCVSLTGYLRRRHDFDRDGRCHWCKTWDSEQWPDLRH